MKAALPDSEATLVLAGLSALSLISQGPDIASFDYWSMLVQLFTTVRDLCRRSQIFRLRGIGNRPGKSWPAGNLSSSIR
jgi:hypothetical protein